MPSQNLGLLSVLFAVTVNDNGRSLKVLYCIFLFALHVYYVYKQLPQADLQIPKG